MYRQITARWPYLGSVAAMISVYPDLAARHQSCQVYAHQLPYVLPTKDLQWASFTVRRMVHSH